MTRHKRIPAFAAFLVSAAAGLALLAATGQFKTPDLQRESLASLERQIVSTHDGHVWLAYGDKLREMNQPEAFAKAVKAYARAVELQPDLTAARLNWGLALAASDSAAFFDYANSLAMSYPKLAVNLLDRPELAPLHADARWQPTLGAAQAQAAD